MQANMCVYIANANFQCKSNVDFNRSGVIKDTNMLANTHRVVVKP